MDDIDDVLKIVLRSDRMTPDFMNIPDRDKYMSYPEVKALRSLRIKYLVGGLGGGFVLFGIIGVFSSSSFPVLVFLALAAGGIVMAKITQGKVVNAVAALYVDDLRKKYQDIKANMSRAEWENYKVNLHTSMNSGR